MVTTGKAKGNTFPTNDDAQALLDKAVTSASTRRNYKSAVKRINAYALKRKRAVDADTIIAFVKYRVKSGVSASAITVDMAAINFIAKTLGIKSPINESVKEVIRAANKKANAEARGVGRASDIDMATAEAACVLALKEKTLVGTRDTAMILVIADALLHPEDILNLNMGDFIDNGKDGVIVVRGDNDNDDLKIVIKSRTVKAINKWIEDAKLSDADDTEPLFRRITAHDELKDGRLYNGKVIQLIKGRLLDAGAGERVSAFSLRRMGCIEFIKGGGTIHELAERGRFKCAMALMRYLNEAAADK